MYTLLSIGLVALNSRHDVVWYGACRPLPNQEDECICNCKIMSHFFCHHPIQCKGHYIHIKGHHSCLWHLIIGQLLCPIWFWHQRVDFLFEGLWLDFWGCWLVDTNQCLTKGRAWRCLHEDLPWLEYDASHHCRQRSKIMRLFETLEMATSSWIGV